MNPYLIVALESTPTIVLHHFYELESEFWDVPTHPDRFTPREVVAHLADWEPILLERLRAGVESPGSTIEAFDEGEMAITNNYATADIEESLNSYINARQDTVDYCRMLEPSKWSLTVIHPERGELKVSDIANMIACHDIYHIKQLMEARKA